MGQRVHLKKWCFLKPTSSHVAAGSSPATAARRGAPPLETSPGDPCTRPDHCSRGPVALTSSGNFLPELLQLRRRPPWALLSKAAAEQVC